MTRPIPDVAVRFIQGEEALVLRVYDDKHPKVALRVGYKPMDGGTLTGGWGHTGSDVTAGRPVTRALATKWLTEDLKKASAALQARIGADCVNALSDHQYAALLSFVFNLGAGAPNKPEWKIWGLLRQGRLDLVPSEMMRFVNWNGQPSNGLKKRRANEVALWNTPDGDEDDDHLPSSVTRHSPTPPTPESVNISGGKAALIGGGGVLGFSGAAEGVKQGATAIQNLVEPQSYHNEWLGKLLGYSALIIVGAGIAVLIMQWFKRRAHR